MMESLRDSENLNKVPSFEGFMMESLRDLGKSQLSSFTWGDLQGNHTVVSKVQVTSTSMDQ